ncbi:MAG: hypothetical protein LBI74_03990, partial [Synergistaceae bacterium]|nr:hypothetical protein [Synergistaceae bacterium]
YAAFIAQVRRYVEEGYELGKAIEQSVRECIERDILSEFLRANTSEVINLLTAEFKMEDAVRVWKEEGIEVGIEKGIMIGMEKGIEKGMEEGRFDVARNMLAEGFSPDIIARSTRLPIEKIREFMN